MNEQIVKLFMQSVDSNYIPLPVEDHIPSWAEKFAKLIVREVFVKIEDERFEVYQPVKESVMKHFGVEE